MSSKLKKKKRYSKQERRENTKTQTMMIPHKEIMNKAFDQSNKYVIENILPVFVLYLIEHFHCKENGVIKFMNWLDEMQKWLDEYPEGFEEVKRDLWDKANVRLEY